MTAQALLVSRDEPDRFARALARKLRWWLLGAPAAIGWGTLRALVRSWIGFSPSRSGVRSAGNGAAMRAPIIGAWFSDADQLAAFVRASSAITHRDPRANAGALAIALAARHAVHARSVDPPALLAEIRERVDDAELDAHLARLSHALERDLPPTELAAALGLSRGVTGYVHHTVPLCLYSWLRSPYDFRRAVTDVITLGGDADTTGAIVGALAGAAVGEAGIPREWLDIVDYPRSLAWIRRLGEHVHTRAGPVPLAWQLVPIRNIAFLAVVIPIALRRMLPPY